MFNIEDPNYEEQVLFWLKHNLPKLEGEVYDSVMEIIECNVDFSGMKVSIAKLNGRTVVLFEIPEEDDYRVYYATEIDTYHDSRLDAYKVDDFFWFYRERVWNFVFQEEMMLGSFGMDMTMPFLGKFL